MRPSLPILVLSLLVSGCVVFPKEPPYRAEYWAGGLPLSASETVVVLVTTEISPAAPAKESGYATAISSPGTVARGFLKGFRAARPDAQIVAADDLLRKACFDPGTKSDPEPGQPVKWTPAPDASECRALIAARGIRYLVPVTGVKWTSPMSAEAVQLSVLGEQRITFSVTARAIDVATGAVACEEHGLEQATWHGGVIWLYIPFPYFQIVDEWGHWEQAAWHAGNRVGLWFVQPDAPGAAEPVTRP